MREDNDARQAWLNRMASAGEDSFLDESLGTLDLSGLYSLRTPPAQAEDGPDGDHLGFNRLDIAPTGGMKQRLAKMVEESACDPGLASELARAGIENPGAPHKFHVGRDWVVTMRRVGGKYVCQAENEDGRAKEFSVREADSDEAMLAATRYLQRDEPRKLSPEDVLRLQRLAQHDVQTALGEYLRLTLPPRMVAAFTDSDDPLSLLNTPSLQPLFREALLNCWYWHTPAAQLSHEFLDYLDAFAGGRVLSFALIDSAWLAYQDHREQQRRSQALGLLRDAAEPAEQQAAPDFESLGDAEIERLKVETLRERAHRIRGR